MNMKRRRPTYPPRIPFSAIPDLSGMIREGDVSAFRRCAKVCDHMGNRSPLPLGMLSDEEVLVIMRTMQAG